MSSTDTDRPGAGRRGSANPDADEIADQIDAIRTDLQNLTSTVGRIANKQLNRAQDKAIATASEAEEAIRRNPLQAVAIARSEEHTSELQSLRHLVCRLLLEK